MFVQHDEFKKIDDKELDLKTTSKEDILNKVMDAEDWDFLNEDYENLPHPKDIAQFRKYLWARHFKLKRVQQLKDLMASIAERYLLKIKKEQEAVDQIEYILKISIQTNSDFRTKQGGYKVDIPDIGTFGCSKPCQKFNASEKLKLKEEFLTQKEPVFSKSLFNDWIKEKLKSGEFSVKNGKLVTEDGKVVEDVEVDESVIWKFPNREEK